MKKLLLILLSITLFTACDVEPLDGDVLNNGNENNTNEEPLALNGYSFDVNSTVPFFGTIIINSDFYFNSNNKVSTSTVAFTFFGQSSTENIVFTRDNSNRITGYTSMTSGVLTNETTITYTGNMITRTEIGSTISTVFTLNGSNQLIRKESFDGTISIKTEVLDYDGLGNCITSVITGEDATSSTFTFDTYASPLKLAFGDQYKLAFLNDDYSDQVGSSMAQFASPNNWLGITTPEGTVNFTVQYDADNRITNRSGSYDLGDGVLIQQSETFSFVN